MKYSASLSAIALTAMVVGLPQAAFAAKAEKALAAAADALEDAEKGKCAEVKQYYESMATYCREGKVKNLRWSHEARKDSATGSILYGSANAVFFPGTAYERPRTQPVTRFCAISVPELAAYIQRQDKKLRSDCRGQLAPGF